MVCVKRLADLLAATGSRNSSPGGGIAPGAKPPITIMAWSNIPPGCQTAAVYPSFSIVFIHDATVASWAVEYLGSIPVIWSVVALGLSALTRSCHASYSCVDSVNWFNRTRSDQPLIAASPQIGRAHV